MTIVQVCSRKMRAAGDQQQQEAVFIKFLWGRESWRHSLTHSLTLSALSHLNFRQELETLEVQETSET